MASGTPQQKRLFTDQEHPSSLSGSDSPFALRRQLNERLDLHRLQGARHLHVSPPGKALAKIAAEVAACKRCVLWKTRTQVVPGQGSPRAELVFVGEAPGAEEDKQGLAFVGRAGRLLTRILNAISLDRDDVFIGNVLKCRPPANRSPLPDETASCLPYLLAQLDIMKPRVICALGAVAASALLGESQPIGRMRGRFIPYRGAKLIATYHPAYLLRNPPEKRKVWEDMQKVRDELGLEESGRKG